MDSISEVFALPSFTQSLWADSSLSGPMFPGIHYLPRMPHYVLSEMEMVVPAAGSGEERSKANISQKTRNKT